MAIIDNTSRVARPARAVRHIWLSAKVAVCAGVAPFVLLQAFAFWIPLVLFFSFAFAGAKNSWVDLFSSSAKIESIWRTLSIAAEVTIICAILSYVYVGALLSSGRFWRKILLIVVIVPVFTSTVVRTYGWIILLGPAGPINTALRSVFGEDAGIDFIYNRSGVLIGMVHVLLPVFVLPLYAVASQIPGNLNRAARAMGANKVAAWVAVDWRLSAPGAAAGAALVFIQALGFFVTSAILGGVGDTMIAQFIDRDMRSTVDLGGAAALSLTLVAAVAVCVIVFRIFYPLEALFIRASQDSGTPPAASRRPGVIPPAISDAIERSWLATTSALAWLPWKFFGRGSAFAIGTYFLMPLLVVIPVSLTGDEFLQFPPQSYDGHWFSSVLTDTGWRLAIVNSLLVGALSVAITLGVAGPLAFILVRAKLPQSVRGMMIGVVLLPAIVPTIVLSVGVYVWFLDVKAVSSLPALALPHSALGLPFAVLVLTSALRDLDPRLEQAGRNLGAGPLQTLMLITLPLLLGSLVAGGLLSFLTSWDELLIARAVTNFDTVTMPVKLWTGANEEISPALAVVSVISMTVTLIATGILSGLARRDKQKDDM
ncbi:ABC transporter permease subunit [Rhizobium mayense]|uniref:ABC transporter permease subunit n=1 Tax=Rhizobium mayense TaxID=1312184 RepID=A0ABT7K5A9_9HYPH|nr:ABC transporter permease subunit [Rhizobium mayense]MDL2403800.1 ABC transporter permease subunit [Rhizobium mayense]